MKKITFLIFMLITTLTYSQGQNSKTFWNNVKLNAGITLGNYSFESETQTVDIKYDYGLGFVIGFDYEAYKSEKITFETGLSFTNHNSTVDQPDLGLKIDYTIYWIGTHAEVNYNLFPDKLSIGLGVFADYGISGTQQFDGGDKIDVFKSQNGNDAPYNNLNYGLTSKISYIMSWTDFADDIYISYRLGLADIEGSDNSTQTFKTGMFTIGVRAHLNNLF